MFGLAILHRFISKGARQRAPWARVSSNVIAVLLLPGFPLGTTIGVYLLLNKDWSGRQRTDEHRSTERLAESRSANEHEITQRRVESLSHGFSDWLDSIMSSLNAMSNEASKGGNEVYIGNVVQINFGLNIYDQNGRLIRTSGLGLGWQLMGYTASTYNLRFGNSIYTYNAQGRQISSAPAIKALDCSSSLGED